MRFWRKTSSLSPFPIVTRANTMICTTINSNKAEQKWNSLNPHQHQVRISILFILFSVFPVKTMFFFLWVTSSLGHDGVKQRVKKYKFWSTSYIFCERGCFFTWCWWGSRLFHFCLTLFELMVVQIIRLVSNSHQGQHNDLHHHQFQQSRTKMEQPQSSSTPGKKRTLFCMFVFCLI